ncbi:hypothetical protein F2Q69_00035690 [Brassica cretica]|uniref:Uncharacterized protein n=1 Tax=Brassica cretica TaxID=69181 RepID=A0A8S9SK84_BRACR|nr:hypothetical protein F2Q69_00035690 [Brassica cretica]
MENNEGSISILDVSWFISPIRYKMNHNSSFNDPYLLSRRRNSTYKKLPEIVAGATSPTDRASLVSTVNRSSRPQSCSSRRDEAVPTDHAAIRVRTKPYAPSKVSTSTRRRRESSLPPSPAVVRLAAAPPSSASPPAEIPVSRCHPPSSPPVTGSTGGLTGLN